MLQIIQSYNLFEMLGIHWAIHYFKMQTHHVIEKHTVNVLCLVKIHFEVYFYVIFSMIKSVLHYGS